MIETKSKKSTYSQISCFFLYVFFPKSTESPYFSRHFYHKIIGRTIISIKEFIWYNKFQVNHPFISAHT